MSVRCKVGFFGVKAGERTGGNEYDDSRLVIWKFVHVISFIAFWIERFHQGSNLVQ